MHWACYVMYMYVRCVIGDQLLMDPHIASLYATYSPTVCQQVTSSSWTHTVAFQGPRCEYNIVAGTGPKECDEPEGNRVGGLVRENNLGMVEVDWEARMMKLSLRRAWAAPDTRYTKLDGVIMSHDIPL